MIYFIKDLHTGNIKIGSSIQLSRRIAALGSLHKTELEVLGVMDGDAVQERILHRVFGDLRMWSEWFLPEKPLLDYIAANASAWDGKDEVPSTTVSLGIEIDGDLSDWLDIYSREKHWSKRTVVEEALRQLQAREAIGGEV